MANGLVIQPPSSPNILGAIGQGLALREQRSATGARQATRKLELRGARDTARIQSVIQGAQILKGIASPQGKIDFLQKRFDERQEPEVGEALALAQAGSFDELEGITDRAISFGQQPRQQEQFTLSPGQVRFGEGGQAIARVEDRPKADTTQRQVNTLRSGVRDVTKTFRSVEESFGRIKSVKPTAAGDLALIFNFMKMLDPGSTVREGEFATAQNAGGVDDRVRNTFNRLVTGERLNPNQRSDFLDQANNLFDSQRQSTDSQISNILQQADQDEISRVKILGKQRLSAFEERRAAVTPPESVAAPPQTVFSSALNRQVSEQDITETLQANPGVTREQLIQQLGIQ